MTETLLYHPTRYYAVCRRPTLSTAGEWATRPMLSTKTPSRLGQAEYLTANHWAIDGLALSGVASVWRTVAVHVLRALLCFRPGLTKPSGKLPNPATNMSVWAGKLAKKQLGCGILLACLSIKMQSQGATDFGSHFRFYLISRHANIMLCTMYISSSAYSCSM